MDLTTHQILARLIISFILGGLIGIERERLERPAGFRTHILVSVGSTLIMMISAYGFHATHGMQYDPGRIAAGVVSGIGFLGAGTIMREGVNVQGLTTAASLWTVSGIGLAVGVGMYYPAILAAVLVVITLLALDYVEVGLRKRNYRVLTIQTLDTPGQLVKIFQILAGYHIKVRNLAFDSDDSGNALVTLAISKTVGKNIEGLLNELMSTSGISKAAIE